MVLENRWRGIVSSIVFAYAMNMSFSTSPSLVLSPALQHFVSEEILEHIQDSLTLVDRFAEPDHHSSFHDYAFIVFPMAKAYEGFLKNYFLRLGILNETHFNSRHFRIGRSFNPDLTKRLRDESWLFDDVSKHCGIPLARAMWEMWVEGRNHTFHYFPDEKHCLNYSQAKSLVHRFVGVMEQAIKCV